MKKLQRIIFALLGVVGMVLVGLAGLVWTFGHDLPSPGEVMADARKTPGYTPLGQISPRLLVAFEADRHKRTPMLEANHLSRLPLAGRSMPMLDWQAKRLLMTLWLEWTIPEDRLLEADLNTAFFGKGVVGVGQAAQAYFDVTPDALSYGQAALLVTINRNPYHCLNHQQGLVRSMPISLNERDAALTEPMPPNPRESSCPPPPNPPTP